MEYTVKVIQILEGYVQIKASSAEKAIQIADKRYNENGESLDECNMDDCEPLTFEVVQ